MQYRITKTTIALLALSIVLFLLAVAGADAQTEKVLYSFKTPTGISSGAHDPSLTVTFDASGNLYAVAQVSGTFAEGPGGIFQLEPKSGGGWTGSPILLFNGGLNGEYPNPSLVADSAGNLYGTTNAGGPYIGGIVFKLSHGSHGWTEEILHGFGKVEADGVFPQAGVILDSAGKVYGTAEGGGANDGGIVFELTQASGGTWKENILYNFGATSTDGTGPGSSLMMDTAGNLYGSTIQGGANSGGTVFELSRQTGGTWKETVLYSFTKGSQPRSAVVRDSAGNLYGTTSTGGLGLGSVFELSKQGNGTWTEKDIHQFLGGVDGFNSMSGLTFDAMGNLYGATMSGGTFGGTNGDGTIYELTPGSGGDWTKSTVFDFNGSDGASPGFGMLTFDSLGNLYAGTQTGGANGYGSVFEIHF